MDAQKSPLQTKRHTPHRACAASPTEPAASRSSWPTHSIPIVRIVPFGTAWIFGRVGKGRIKKIVTSCEWRVLRGIIPMPKIHETVDERKVIREFFRCPENLGHVQANPKSTIRRRCAVGPAFKRLFDTRDDGWETLTKLSYG